MWTASIPRVNGKSCNKTASCSSVIFRNGGGMRSLLNEVSSSLSLGRGVSWSANVTAQSLHTCDRAYSEVSSVMAPRITRGQNNPSLRPLLFVLLLGLLPSLAAVQARDWAVTYDSGGPDWLGCTYCSHPWLGLVPEPVRSARAVTADTAGNSWITGGAFNGTNYDVVTVKYDAQGVRQW